MEVKLCSFKDRECHSWALRMLQVKRTVWLGCTSTDALCGILMQLPQMDLGTLHQYLFVDQLEWLGLNLKWDHSNICRKSLPVTMKIADALVAPLHNLKVPSCPDRCFSDSRTQYPCEVKYPWRDSWGLAPTSWVFAGIYLLRLRGIQTCTVYTA